MLRTMKIGAIVALATLNGAPAAGAQSLTWGVFRENATNVSESARNCWSQAMVSGLTINGEVMAQNLTEHRAELELESLAKRGLCAAERTAPSWSARGQEHANFGGSDFGGSSSGGSNADGFDSSWSNAGRFNTNADSSNFGPLNGGR
jgi:hypothetical protein